MSNLTNTLLKIVKNWQQSMRCLENEILHKKFIIQVVCMWSSFQDITVETTCMCKRKREILNIIILPGFFANYGNIA